MDTLTPRLRLPVHAHWSQAPWDAARWPNFSPAELACKGTGRLAYHPETLDKLQALRRDLGGPVMVTSAYRSPEHNRSVGGARTSWHMEGIAFDVRVENHDPHALITAARALGFSGVGTYPRSRFVHLDTRGDFHAPPARWGDPFPPGAQRFSTPEPVEQPPATAAGRAAAAGTGAGVALAVAQAAPAIEAAGRLPESVQLALIGGGVALAVALVIWGPDGLRRLRDRWRNGDEADL